ncbi:hypothetical protein AAG906_011218 [Vitis piasezkii]
MSTCQVIILDSEAPKSRAKPRFIGNDCSSLWKDQSACAIFSSLSEDTNDLGDGGGTPTFLFNLANLFFWFIDLMKTVIVGTSNHDVLACQYIFPNSCKKLAEELVQMFILELNLKVNFAVSRELDDLGRIQKKLVGFESHSLVIRSNQSDHEILWVDEIFAIIGKEMHVGLS